jgi:hypothetical protein
MARRWRAADEADTEVPYGPAPELPEGIVAEGSR